jgi:hypothetical protein
MDLTLPLVSVFAWVPPSFEQIAVVAVSDPQHHGDQYPSPMSLSHHRGYTLHPSWNESYNEQDLKEFKPLTKVSLRTKRHPSHALSPFEEAQQPSLDNELLG